MAEPGDLDVAALRREYRLATLTEETAAADALVQFGRWMGDAVAAHVAEPNAMVLSTVGLDGTPSARNVLLKGLDTRGFAFYTNRGSRKARELAQRPLAALLFPWVEIQRQVEVAGPVVDIPDDEADAYFATRPRDSQVGAWASRQSSPLTGRGELEDAAAAARVRFDGTDIPRPPFWGGFRVVALRVEFWQGRPGRLHDRLRYQRGSERDPWVRERLAP